MQDNVPSYDFFIEPVLQVLANCPEGVPAREVHEAAADYLDLSHDARLETVSSGQAIYKNRSGWAHDRLKRAGLSESISRGVWCLTEKGLDWVKTHRFPLSEETRRHLAFDFLEVKLTDAEGADAASLNYANTQTDRGESLSVESPDDRLEEAVRTIKETVASELLTILKEVSPQRFELIVLDLLHKLGYGLNRASIQRVGGSHDGGIDGIISLDRLGLEKVYVQAKRWQDTVGRPEIQAFYGALAGQKAKRGVFITTSSYSKQAIEFAQSVEGVVLIDGVQLVYLMMDAEVGVSSRSIKLPAIDSDYFD